MRFGKFLRQVVPMGAVRLIFKAGGADGCGSAKFEGRWCRWVRFGGFSRQVVPMGRFGRFSRQVVPMDAFRRILKAGGADGCGSADF